ncbi:MAG: P-loop NTPase [Gemmatimonadales bacterium]
MTFRTYHELDQSDRSEVGAQVEMQRARLQGRLESVRSVVAVMSGKGGVGKSYVTALVAAAAARTAPDRIGVLDADLASPTVARMLGARGRLETATNGVRPVSARDGLRVVSTEFLLAEDAPLKWREPRGDRWLWRGALAAGVLREFLAEVDWGPLDLLLIDLPPGIDGIVDVGTLLPKLDGVVAVTVPSEESRRSVARALEAALEAGLPVVGIVENMAGIACEGCGTMAPLFEGDAGKRLAERFRVPLLGRLPFRQGAPSDPSPEGDALALRVMEALS